MKKNNRNKLVPGLDSLESRELLAASPIAVPAVASAQIQMASATKLKRFSETIYVDNALIGSSKTVDLKVRDFRGEGEFRRLLVSDLNGKLEKWNTKLGQWQNVKPLTLGQAARLPEDLLFRHTLGLQDKLRWRPGFSVSPDISGQTSAFRVTGIGKARALVTTPGVPAAVENLTVTPTGTGQVLLDWSPAAGATSYKLLLNGQTVIDRLYGTSRFFDNLNALNRYNFSVVPINASGSGPETKVVFGRSKVEWDSGLGTPMSMAVAQDGSIWFLTAFDIYTKGWAHHVINDDGDWMLRESIAVGEFPSYIATGPDGVVWVVFQPGKSSGYVQRIAKHRDDTWVKEGDPIQTEFPYALTVGTDGTAWIAGRPNDGEWGDGIAQHIVQDEHGQWGLQRFGDDLSIPLAAGTAVAATTGLDGSIWVLCGKGALVRDSYVMRIGQRNGTWAVDTVMTVDNRAVASGDLIAGADGSIWVSAAPTGEFSTVQRIVNENGTWFVKGDPLHINPEPSSLTPGSDGSLWVLNKGDSETTLQHVVHERGTWFVKGDPLPLRRWETVGVNMAKILATSPDGSLWYGYSGALEQIWTNPSAPTDLSAVADRSAGKATLSWKAPAADGGTPVTSYTVTARQGATIKTDTNWGDTAYTFSGLDFSKGPIYFTVAANNFAGTSPVDTLLIGQDGKPIDTTSLTTGITTDGTWILGDGFDTLGQTYSWEALGSGRPVPFGNAVFTFGLPNQPDTYIAKGQTIPVPQGGDYGTINLAAAAVYYGAQPNQVFKLNYTDGTTGTWTQSISDWAKPQNFPGEQSLALSYYNRNDATRGQNEVYLYGYSQALEKGKVLESITLPNNPNVRILDIQMGKSSQWNTGITTDGTRFVGGLDGQGNAFSWEALGSGNPIPFGKNVKFEPGTPNQPGVRTMAGQTIEVPQGDYGTINLAATAVNGARKDRLFKLLFTDGSTESWLQSISDWGAPQNFDGETTILTMGYRNRGDGTKDQRPVNLYGYSHPIPAGKTLKSITLMQTDPNVRILDIQMTYAPSISTQPTNQTANVGSRATFTAAATGNPAPTVKWQSSPDGTIWKDISGATANSYTTPTLAAADNGKKFRAIYTNGIGIDATTNAATLTVNVTSAPVITGQPVSIGLEAGQTATFTASATGNPTPTVQWQSSPNGSTGWADITGATSGTLSFTATAGNNGTFYRAVFTNGISPAATTKTAKLSIGIAPVIITASEMTIPVGLTSGMTVRATGSPAPTYSITQGSLPAGVTLDSTTGVLSGRPAAGTAGSWPIRIKANNGIGNGVTQEFRLKVTSTVTSFTVSEGLAQRSYIRYLDLGMDSNASALALLNNPGRVQLTRADLNGVGSTPVPLTGFLSVPTGQSKLSIDFGTDGLGNSRNTNASDGYYTLGVDLDGNGTFETNLFFFRLLGDTSGNRVVTAADQNAVLAGLTQDYNANLDVNGDGVVNTSDFQYVKKSLGRKIKSTLIVTA